MGIEEVREDLRSGRDVMAGLPLATVHREVVNLGNGNLVAAVKGLLNILAINTRQIDESIEPRLDAIAEGGRYTKACIDASIGADPEYPGFSQAGQAAEAIHESGKAMLQQSGGMKLNYVHAQIYLERALSSLGEAVQSQNSISSELATAADKQMEVLHTMHMLDPDL